MLDIECFLIYPVKRSYIQRKRHIIRFFSSLWSWRHTFFFTKLIKLYNIILQSIILITKQNQSKTFSEIKQCSFQNWEECDRKNGVICTLSSCEIWCTVLIPVVFALFDWETCMECIKVSFSKHYNILSIFIWIFCKL